MGISSTALISTPNFFFFFNPVLALHVVRVAALLSGYFITQTHKHTYGETKIGGGYRSTTFLPDTMAQNSDGSEVSNAMPERSQSSLMLVDCLHPSVFACNNDTADSLDTLRCLRTLQRLLSNHRQHPSDPRYTSFCAASSTWQHGVLPCVYVLRLIAWMGCAPDTEGARYAFLKGESAEEHLRKLDDRLDELQCVMAVWTTSIAALSRAETSSGAADVASAERGERLASAQKSLKSLYTAACNSLPSAHEDAKEVYTRSLQAHLLWRASRALTLAASHTDSAASRIEHAVPAGDASQSASWRLRVAASLRASPLLQLSPSLPPRTVSNEEMQDPLQWLLLRTSLSELTQECVRAAAAADAARAAPVVRTSRASEVSSSSLSPSASIGLAERFRVQACLEQRQRYLDTTGPAYRQLSHEERHRGESVVLDIAGLLEQLAVVTETQGMVRVDRQEARRLLEAFKRDGDLVALYALQDQYAAQLDEAKKQYGKPLVYAEYE